MAVKTNVKEVKQNTGKEGLKQKPITWKGQQIVERTIIKKEGGYK
jgi:hypothetical protein